MEKVVMLVGASGANTRSLMEGMVNYAFGVKTSDDLRLKIISKVQESGGFMFYTFHNWPDPRQSHSLTVILTPGFKGHYETDKSTVELFKQLFVSQGLTRLSSVGFVVDKSLTQIARSRQDYICDSILSMFGKDIANNVILMKTSHNYLDLSPTIPSSQYIDLFRNAEGGNPLWQMNIDSFSILFSALNTKSDVSLTMTNDIPNKKNELEKAVVVFEVQFQELLAFIKKIGSIKASTYCLTCNTVCHCNCHSGTDTKHSCSEITAESLESSSSLVLPTCNILNAFGLEVNTPSPLSQFSCSQCNCGWFRHSCTSYMQHLKYVRFRKLVSKTHASYTKLKDTQLKLDPLTKPDCIDMLMGFDSDNDTWKQLKKQARIVSSLDDIKKCFDENGENVSGDEIIQSTVRNIAKLIQ